MIVTCPSCSVRYVLDARALGEAGRTVRCARCAHTWHQTPPAEAPPPVDEPPAPVEAPPIERAPSPSPPPPPSPEKVQLPALPKKKRRWGGAVAAAAVFLLLVAAGFGAVTQREWVVQHWPPARPLYATLGLRVADINGLGLELRKVMPSRDMADGVPMLVIDGEVANVSTVIRTVPKLKVILRDNGKHDLQNWTFTVTNERLSPGQIVTFHTSVTKPSEQATDVVVTFASGS
jgi:predicted Zn finger-like uncharacterized protein